MPKLTPHLIHLSFNSRARAFWSAGGRPYLAYVGFQIPRPAKRFTNFVTLGVGISPDASSPACEISACGTSLNPGI